MATRSQRGRPAPTRKNNPLLPLYALLAIAVVGGIALFALSLNKPATTTATSSGSSPVDVASLSSYPSMGSASAPVTVVEFADYQCPSCAAYATTMAAQIEKDYIDTGKVRLIYHELPISSHANAVVAAEAARAAGDQNKYWEMNKLLYARQNDWAQLSNDQAVAKFASYAQELGLDATTFNQTMQSQKYRTTIEAALQDSIKANIQFTPSFVIDGKIYEASNLRSALDAALAK